MSKTREVKSSAKKAGKAVSKPLSAVKDAKVTKSAQAPQARSKSTAKTIAGKHNASEKKSKKKAKEPTPEPSSEESEEDADSDSDSSEDQARAAKASGSGPMRKAETSGSDSDDTSAADSSSEDGAPAKSRPVSKVNGATKTNGAVKKNDSDDSSDDEDSDASAEPQKATKVVTKGDDTSEESESSENDVTPDDEDSDESESEEEEQAAPTKKRKADAVAESSPKKSKTEEDTSDGIKNLFVGGLSWNIDDAWLRRDFEKFGEVERAAVMTDRDSGRSKGFGYVEFATVAAADKALAEMHGVEIDGRPIRLDKSAPRTSGAGGNNPRAAKFGDNIGAPTDTLFLGNLSFDVTNDILKEGFAEYGTITRVSIPTDYDTGRVKGFGYVSFSSVDEAKAALEACNGVEIAGRAVRIDYSQPRPERSNSFGGGRGGRGGGGRGGGRGGFGDRGGRGGGRGRGAPRGGRGGSTNRGGYNDFKGNKISFD